MRRMTSSELDAEIGRHIFSAAHVGVALVSGKGRILRANPAFCKFLGYAERDLCRRTLFQITHPDDRCASSKAIRRARRVADFQIIEKRYLHQSGKVLWGEECRRPVGIGEEGAAGCLVQVTDITARKEAMQALEESELRYRSLFAQAADSIVIFDPTTAKVLEFNDAACRRLGYTPEEFRKLKISDYDMVESLAEVKRHSRQAVSRGGLVFETAHRTKSGEVLDMEIRAAPVRIGKRILVQGIWQDITARKRAQMELQKARAELELKVKERTAKLRALAVQLDRAEARERERIAQVLHDELQQIISGARFTLRGLRDSAAKFGQQSTLEKTDDYLEKAHQVMRALCMDLHPPVLHEVGLHAALKWLKRDMGEKFGLTVEVEADKRAEPSTASLRTVAFQSVRELLFNVAKHAGVKVARVRLARMDADRTVIEVEDKGAGFDPARAKPNAYGLFSIRERIDCVGGAVKIQSAPGKGARITLTLPRI